MGGHQIRRSNRGRMSRHIMTVKMGMLFVEEGGNGFFHPCSSAFNSLLLWFCLPLFLLVVFHYQPIRVKVLPWFPRVVTRGIALPLDQEVYLAPSASWLRIQDLLDFEFLFPFYQIRRRMGKVLSM